MGKFEVGNSANGGNQSPLRKKAFREQCRSFVEEGEDGGTSGFKILREVAIGYKGVKPSDRVAAVVAMAKYGGLTPPETTVNANINADLRGLTDDELKDMAKRLIGVSEATKGIEKRGSVDAIPVKSESLKVENGG